ncbi:MAG: hypothetical protein QG633_252 [Patescibacteria group bacterium]|jgi:hypothetical protein|nr:hypothetical protein [Patescibacteria group bacterium]
MKRSRIIILVLLVLLVVVCSAREHLTNIFLGDSKALLEEYIDISVSDQKAREHRLARERDPRSKIPTLFIEGKEAPASPSTAPGGQFEYTGSCKPVSDSCSGIITNTTTGDHFSFYPRMVDGWVDGSHFLAYGEIHEDPLTQATFMYLFPVADPDIFSDMEGINHADDTEKMMNDKYSIFRLHKDEYFVNGIRAAQGLISFEVGSVTSSSTILYEYDIASKTLTPDRR